MPRRTQRDCCTRSACAPRRPSQQRRLSAAGHGSGAPVLWLDCRLDASEHNPVAAQTTVAHFALCHAALVAAQVTGFRRQAEFAVRTVMNFRGRGRACSGYCRMQSTHNANDEAISGPLCPQTARWAISIPELADARLVYPKMVGNLVHDGAPDLIAQRGQCATSSL